MKKVFLGLIGLLLVVVMVSGCTTTTKKETVIFDKNLSSANSELNQTFITVPNDAEIRVEISNMTFIPDSFTGNNTIKGLFIYGLNVEGQNGQTIVNYDGNIIDQKTFEVVDGFSGNTTFKPGLKSVCIAPTNMKAHFRIVAIN